jgi:hypothetical protein
MAITKSYILVGIKQNLMKLLREWSLFMGGGVGKLEGVGASMVPFCRCPPPDKFLKKPCVQIISLYEDGLWVMVGQMLHCKVVTYKYIYFLIIYG